MQSAAVAIRQIGLGLLIAISVFVAAVLYAFLAPATYRASAVIAIGYPKAAKALPPAEAKSRLEQSVLGASSVRELAKEMESASERADVDHQIREGTELTTSDGRTFKLSFSDSNASRAQRIAGALARHAVKEVPAVFTPPRAPGAAAMPVLPDEQAKATIVSDAVLPQTPVRPNRRRVLLVGALAALAVLVISWLGTALRRQRAPRSRRASGAPTVRKSERPAARDKPGREDKSSGEQRVVSDIPTLIGNVKPSPLEMAVASFAAERARVNDSIEIELPPPTPKVLPELVHALEAWRSSSKLRAAADVSGEPALAQKQQAAPTIVVEVPAAPVLEPPARPVASATIDVGASAPGPDSEPPPSRPRRRRRGSGGTLMMGSFSAPEPPREKNAPLSVRPKVAETTYRYASTPPPKSERKPEPKPEAKAEPPAVNVVRAPLGWAPDATLILPLHKPLREQLYACAVERCMTVIVTGAFDVSDAKSRVAVGLALALADTGHPRILMMEANFHHPMVHRLIGVEPPVMLGFSQQLHAKIHGDNGKPWSVVGCAPTLHVLGESVMRSPGMILSKQFEHSLRDLQKYYDVIVIDAPDTSFEFDCRALDSLADGLILVCSDPNSPAVDRAQRLFSPKRFATVVSANE